MSKRTAIITLAGVFMLGIFMGVAISCAVFLTAAQAEDEPAPLIVTATHLNGREHPRKTAIPAALYDCGDRIHPTGEWSRDRKWVEIEGGESGTVWVYYEYVTERTEPFRAVNASDGKVKVRSVPGGGRVNGYIKRGKAVTVDRVIMGWGHCSKGWIDLDYFREDP